VLKLATTASENKVKILAVRGAIRLIPLQDAPVDKKLAGFKEIVPLIQRDEEKLLLLGSLAAVPTSDSLAMAMGYLANPSTKNEACFAAVAIAETIGATNAAEVAGAMEKVVAAATNDDVKKRAKAVLDKVR